MVAKELISVHIPSMSFSKSGEDAMGIMDEYRLEHVAVVDGETYQGLISDTEILDLDDSFAPLNKVKPTLIRPFVNAYSHLYDIIGVASQAKLTVIPVLDDHEKFLGVISIQDLAFYFARITNAHEPGGVLILGLNIRDYSMAQVAQIIESDNAKILSSYITSQEDSMKIDLILKINKKDLSGIIAAFNRYDYEVKATFHESANDEDLESRYEQFIKYINM